MGLFDAVSSKFFGDKKTFQTAYGSVSLTANITPDKLVGYQNTTFVLLSANVSPTKKEEFLIGPKTLHITHTHLIANFLNDNKTPYTELLEKAIDYVNEIEKQPDSYVFGRMLESTPQLIAFWQMQVTPLLKKSLQYLNKYVEVHPDAVIHIGKKFYKLDDIEGNVQEPNQEEKDEIEKARRLHLMEPIEKRKEMEKMGLSFGSKYHPLHEPGKKWWAPTSESFKSWLESDVEVPFGGGAYHVKVLKNPSSQELLSKSRELFQGDHYARGILNASGDVFIWNGEYEHYAMNKKLKENIKIAFELSKGLGGQWLLAVSDYSTPGSTGMYDDDRMGTLKQQLLRNSNMQNMLSGLNVI